jgi:16S rRNA (guanine527-N7)-methyltransferase
VNAPRLAPILARGLDVMGLNLASGDQQRLLDYLSLLAEWNGAYNLTAVRDPVDMVPRHILDSLTVLPWLRGDQIVDVGSGAGLPGIPLAIADAGRRYTLIESNGKKVRFLRHAVRRLGLAHVEVVHGRAEASDLARPADTIVARAVTDLTQLCAYARHLGGPAARLVAMKGPYGEAQLEQLLADFTVGDIIPVTVPGLDVSRRLIVLQRMPAE